MTGDYNFSLDVLPGKGRPIVQLGKYSALVDTGCEYVVLALSDKVIINTYGGVDANHYTHIQGINKAAEDDTLGKVFVLGHFSVGPLEYTNIPVIAKDIADPEVDIVLGGSLFGRDSSVTWDKRSHQVKIFVPEMTGRSQCLWEMNEEGICIPLKRLKNTFAFPGDDLS